MRDDNRKVLDPEALRMICSISSGMLGICLTCISLMRIVISVRRRDTIADDLLTVNAVMFLFTLMTAYYALRQIGDRRLHRLEKIADISFLTSMAFLAINSLVVTYAISSV